MPTRLLLFSLLLCAASLRAQNIYTIAGKPKYHKSTLDGKIALDVKLNFIYGLMLDRLTGRILLHNESVVSHPSSTP